jgi:hypothetical protein
MIQLQRGTGVFHLLKVSAFLVPEGEDGRWWVEIENENIAAGVSAYWMRQGTRGGGGYKTMMFLECGP